MALGSRGTLSSPQALKTHPTDTVTLRPIAILAIVLSACGSPDDSAEPVPPARSVLEVVIDDSVLPPTDSIVSRDALGGMCLRGDPTVGDAWAMDQVDDTLAVLTLQRLTDLAARDSARLAARLARTADALPGDTLVADFRGLPVVVREAWLLVPESGDTTYVGIASRRLPMESTPLEEQLTLLAVPDSARGANRALIARWFARSAGMEDSLETRDPVLAYRAPDGSLRLLLLRETGAEPRMEMLVRIDDNWRRQWMGTVPACR